MRIDAVTAAGSGDRVSALDLGQAAVDDEAYRRLGSRLTEPVTPGVIYPVATETRRGEVAVRVGSIAVGCSGDKGSTLDLTLVAVDDEAYGWLDSRLTEPVTPAAIYPLVTETRRGELP